MSMSFLKLFQLFIMGKLFSTDNPWMKSLLPLSTLFEQGSSKLSSTSKQLALVFQELPKAEAESSTAPVAVLKSSVWMLLKLPQRPWVGGREEKKKINHINGKRNDSRINTLRSIKVLAWKQLIFLKFPQIKQHTYCLYTIIIIFCLTVVLSDSTEIGGCLNVLH